MHRRLRFAIAAVCLLLCGALWTPSFLPPRLPLSNHSYSGASHPASSLTNTLTWLFRQTTEPRIPASSERPASQAPPPRPLLVLHWTERFNNSFYFKVNNASFSGCPVSNCEGTSDRNLLSKADVVLIHGNRMNVTDLPERWLSRQRFVFVIQESPQTTQVMHLPLQKLDGFFNLTMTYSRDADVLFPYAQTAAGKQAGTLPSFHRRRRMVAWMVSSCNTTSQREQYVSQLRRHLPVDIIGGCGNNSCPKGQRDCHRRLAETHLFYLAFENSLSDDYITEKFWTALKVGMVPVVRGPPPEAYRRVAPPHSFIHVEDFAGPRALASYLISLAQNQAEYDQYHTWRHSHRVQYPGGLCNLCSRLDRGGQDPAVQLSKVWSAEVHCRKPRDLDTNG